MFILYCTVVTSTTVILSNSFSFDLQEKLAAHFWMFFVVVVVYFLCETHVLPVVSHPIHGHVRQKSGFNTECRFTIFNHRSKPKRGVFFFDTLHTGAFTVSKNNSALYDFKS